MTLYPRAAQGVSPNVAFTNEQFKELMATVLKHTPASTTPDAPTLHGPFPESTTQWGIFSRPGVRPQRYSALTRPWSLANVLGLESSNLLTEILEVMTGVTDASGGTNATSWCGNPPVPGQAKVCQQIYKWGKWFMKTHLNVLPEIGTLRNRSDVPAQIMNAGPSNNPFIPDLMYRLADPQSQLQYELFLVGVALERRLEIVLARGNNATAAANTQVGWMAEFNGLDQLVKTGHTDAVTGLTCPAMDSVVINYNANVNTTTVGGRNIVQVISDMVYGIRQRAVKNGMSPSWVFVMREELFKSLVENYVCNYNTYRCSGATNQPLNNDAAEINRMRLAMQNGMYLEVDGVPYPVVWTEGIADATPLANTHESDLFFIPVSDAGTPLTRIQYFPMDNQYIQEFSAFAGDQIAILNNGMYMAAPRDNGFCKEYLFGAKMRLILETPWLAGRIDNLQYTFSANIRNAIPDASFYADGGISIATWPGIATT